MTTKTASEPNAYDSIALVDMGDQFAQHWFGTGKNYDATIDGVLTALDRIQRSVSHMVVCLDHPPYFRKEIYPGYKASRPASTPEMNECKRELREKCEARGYRLARAKGYEADDIIAGLAAVYRLVCDDVRIVGRDKDLLQLLNGKVRMFRPAKGGDPEVLIDGPAVFSSHGVAPGQIVDWLALTGDKGDDVPGCPGVGDRTAAKILAAFGSVPALYARLESEPATVQETLGKSVAWKLREHREDVMRARSLVALRLDAPIDATDLLLPGTPRVIDTVHTEPVPAAGDDEDAFDRELEALDPEAVSETRAAEADPVARVAGHVQAAYPGITDAKAAEVARATLYPNPSGKPEGDLLDPAAAIPAGDPKAKPMLQPEVERAVAAAHAVAGDARPSHAGEVVGNDVGPQGEPKTGVVRESSTSTELTGKQSAGWDIALEPRGLAQAKWVAETLAPMFPKLGGWQGTLGVIMCGRELGLGTMASLMNFDIVEGRPSPRWQVIVAFAMQHPESEYFRLVESTNEGATYVAKRRGNPEVTMSFTVEDAKRAGLYKPSSGWQKYPAALCRKMCAVHLARALFPDSKASGLYCPEELAAA